MTTLLVDIGRRWVRVGLAVDGARPTVLDRIETPSGAARLLPALKEWALQHVSSLEDIGIAIAAPGPFAGDRYEPLGMENWGFRLLELQADFPGRSFVIHDVIAAARSIPELRSDEFTPLIAVEEAPQVSAPVLYIQTGVGLGVSALIPLADGSVLPFSGEGGSATIAAANEVEQKVIDATRDPDAPDLENYGFYSAQRLLSAKSLPFLHLITTGKNVSKAEEVTERYRSGDEQASQTMDVFAGLLGTFAGDMALTFRSYGGVYIGGPLPALLNGTAFARLKHNFVTVRGSAADQMRTIPVYAVTDQYNTLTGLNNIAKEYGVLR